MANQLDIRQMIGTVVNLVKSKTTTVCTAPCDGLVLKMHYRWTFYVLIAGFSTVWYSWYQSTIISCVSHFNVEEKVRMDFVNICLSYPFLQNEDNSRRYILFYRWIHWIFLLLAAVYYIPRKLSKNIENNRFKSLLEEISQHSYRYDHIENQIFNYVYVYVTSSLQTHNSLYIKYVLLNVLALGIDIFTLCFLDFVLHGYFISYGFNSYPFERDPLRFTDYISVMFPPFASCELDKANQLTASRTEVLGCHLTLMELYEKIFLYLWVWLVILIFITCVYIVFLMLMMIPSFRQYVLRPSKPVFGNHEVKDIIEGVNKSCKIGDIYVLYRVKQFLSHVKFYELLYAMSRFERFGEAQLSSSEIDVERQVQAGNMVFMKQRGNVRPQCSSQQSAPVVMSLEDLHKQL